MSSLHKNLARATKLHYLFLALVAGQIVAFDAWQLITPEAVLKRWIAAGILLVVVTIVWYRLNTKKYAKDRLGQLVWWLVAADILFVSYFVYLSRGVASKYVALYALPIVVSLLLQSRRALLTAVVASAAAYLLSVTAYATIHFNESYKIERYGEAFFYAGVMWLLASLLWIVAKTKKRL